MVPPADEGAVVAQPEGGAVVPAPAPGAVVSPPAGPTSLFAGQEDTVEGRGALQDAPGGIDFATLELRYLAEGDAADGGSVRYAFSAEQLAGAPAGGGPEAAQQASDAFFVWLALPRSAFTVNLNPDEPDRIIDPGLGGTDAGRILLEADLQLKRTVAGLIHPDTELGAGYWDLILGSGGQACQSFRQWIVPAPARVWDDGDELYILDAPLEVKMETEYLQSAGVAAADACPQQPPSAEEQNENAFRTMILPEVERAVNEAPEYAALRQVYLSRVAAEWYRQRSETERLSFTDIVDDGDVTAWPARVPWAPREVFDRYVESFTNGEFNVTRQTREGDYILTHTYVFGGVDWTQVTLEQTSPDQLQSRWPELVEDSFDGPTADRDGRIWLSSASTITAPTARPPGSPSGGAAPGPADEDGGWLSLYVVIGVLVVAAGIAIRSWVRVRRRRSRSAAGTGPPW